MDFGQSAGAQTNSECIPKGQLAFAILSVRGVKPSQKGGQYIDVELTIDDGQPYARRKIWEMIGDPYHPGNSDAYKQMGSIAICRILEAGRGAGPNNPAGYNINSYEELHGLRVPIKIKIEKGNDGYDDKNKVAEWLTPNPASQSGFKAYEMLMSGQYNVSPDAQTPPSGFANPASTQTSMFGSPQAQQGVPAAGFQQPAAGTTQPQNTPAQNAGNWGSSPDQASSAAAAKSPSDQGGEAVKTPGWLEQANAGSQGG